MIYLLFIVLIISSVYFGGFIGSRVILKRYAIEPSIIDEKSRFDTLNYLFLGFYMRLWKDDFKLFDTAGIPFNINDIIPIILWIVLYQLFSNWIYIKRMNYRRISLIVYLLLSNALYALYVYLSA